MSHDGGDATGEFCFTLNLTPFATGWTEMRALRNKAQRWVAEALVEIAQTLPFPLLGLDSDNGGEFINHHLFALCEANEITFTRSRPSRVRPVSVFSCPLAVPLHRPEQPARP